MGGNQSTQSQDSPPGVSFQHFQVLRAIGRGSFGKVCIAQKKDNKRMFAMKYTNKAKAIQKDAFTNVLREIDILASINHPFVVNLWFTFQDEEDIFVVTDLFLGGDMRYHLNHDGRFSEDRAKLYICEMALAIDYLHKQRIMHRDVKPENMLLDDHGHTHLTDFNIATRLDQDCLATSMTGTRPYMAPEIFKTTCQEHVGYSFEVDWWSLGVCFYEMLRGRRPYELGSQTHPLEARNILVNSSLAIPVDWPNDLVAFLGGLLKVDPHERINSIAAFSCHSYMERISMEDVLRGKTAPIFIPAQDSLNCDPSFELEEMLIESKPLHKKKKRLHKKSDSSRDLAELDEAAASLTSQFKLYNRETLLKKEEERLELLQQELGLRIDPAQDAIGKILGRVEESLD